MFGNHKAEARLALWEGGLNFIIFEQMNLKHELQSIISGTGATTKGNLIQTAAHYLRESKKAGRNTQEIQFTKEQETEKLIEWVQQNNLWYNKIDETRFIASGAPAILSLQYKLFNTFSAFVLLLYLSVVTNYRQLSSFYS